MKQVLVKGGKVQIDEVPPPATTPGVALVRISRSLISSGTESGFVSDGGTAAFVLKKAKDPLNIEKVKRKLATVGWKGTIDVIRNKLFQFQAPGYSSSGVVVELGADVPGFCVGDRVACSGTGYASHAEYNTVPHQLLTPIPDGVDFDEAAFVTLGAIAMQGVRRAQPTFGETFVVSGLGLVGQLAAQIAQAAGCHVIASDPIPEKRALALELGADAVCAPDELAATIAEWTAGYGADGVIICAASKGSGVTNQALDVCRAKGRVSVVGAVGLQLEREPMYMKELDFFLSCSYGPGRYNAAYEEKGLDYPIGYVRWTEGRNMAEFLRMIAEKKVRVKPLISLSKPVDEAQAAYDAILSGDGNAIAAVITYGDGSQEAAVPNRVMTLKKRGTKKGEVGVAVVGAGGIAQAFHLPNLRRIAGCRLTAVADRLGSTAKQAAEKFGADYCTTDFRAVLGDDDIDAVVIATRHHLHKEMTIAALEAGKHVFVEKPLALSVPDCEEICRVVEKTGRLLTVGFNRRFSIWAQQARAAFAKVPGPRMMLYRCNAGSITPGHWSTDPVEGGGRILGEAVHFYDLCCWMLDQDPVAVSAERVNGGERTDIPAEDNLVTQLRFPDGALATVFYCTLGHPAISKEYIELYGGKGTIVIDDFQGVQFAGIPGKSVKKAAMDKGMQGLLENFIQAIRGEAELSVTAAHGLRATRIAVESIARARGITP